MKRREFVQTVPLATLVPAGLATQVGLAQAEEAAGAASASGDAATKTAAPAGSTEAPAWAPDFKTTDCRCGGRLLHGRAISDGLSDHGLRQWGADFRAVLRACQGCA
jgi:type IV secretory pathway TrbL component